VGQEPPASAVDASVTDLGEPALVRATSIEIARGAILAGRYQIEAAIGKGGSGIVLRAFDRVAQVPVAIKILKPDLAMDPRWIERFSRELRLARQIQHPNVCRVFDIGQADGHWFITMELATAGTLRDQLAENAAQRTLDEKLTDVRAVVAGLAAIHGAGIVHRDVKPDNFLRLADGRLVLSDFGLATNPADAPAVSIMVGTPHYMAPEVVMGDVASPRSDIWAAGVVIHEILMGARPERSSMTRTPVAKTPRDAPRATGALLRVCQKSLSDEPNDRPADGAALARLVDDAIDARAAGTFGARMRGNRNVAWGLTLVATLSLTAFLGKRLWQPAKATSSMTGSSVMDVAITGTPVDWTPGSKVFATFDQRVHCFSILPGGEVARVIWGTPRRAEEIDLGSGQRTPAQLPPETYAADCPELSPRADSLLFTRVSSTAPSQVMRATPTGDNPVAVTNGSEPRWLPNGDEFLYNVDANHVGLFSLPTMTPSILPDTQDQGRRYLYKRATSADGSLAAILYNTDATARLLEIHALPDLRLVASWRVPLSIRGVAFDGAALLMSDIDKPGALDILNWRSGKGRRGGYVERGTLEQILPVTATSSVLLSSDKRSDVWIFASATETKRLTNDGHTYGASWSPSGDVLVSRQLDDGRLVIERYDSAGRSRQVTEGPLDMVPSFSADGRSWVYSDYRQSAVIRCAGDRCQNVRSVKLPGWPTISPDGNYITFLDQGGTHHLSVGRIGDEAIRDLGPVALECPPVWTSSTSLWAYSGTSNARRWEEIDLPTGKKTGRYKTAAKSNEDMFACGAESAPPESPFFQHARVVARESWQARLGMNIRPVD
jgi:serine/threonine protein kinase